MPTVTGIIISTDNSPAVGYTVHAFDKDMRSEQPLGEAITSEGGSYVIRYTSDQFLRAEKKSADVFIRVVDKDNTLLGQSDIVFNSPDELRIDLTLEYQLEPPNRRVSEMEQLLEFIEPLRESVDYHLFTDDDLTFLTEETIREGVLGNTNRRIIRQRLDFINLAARFEQLTDIPLAAYYGWFRLELPQDLEALLDESHLRLRRTLTQAITDAIIPYISLQIPRIIARIRLLRFSLGRLINHRFVARLIDVATGKTLGNLFIDVHDQDVETEEQDQVTVSTDRQGIFIFNFVLPGDAGENATRSLQLTIRDEERILAVTEINVLANQTEIVDIRINVTPDAQEQISIVDLASVTLGRRLREQGIDTIADLMANPNLTDTTEPDELERLRGKAKWMVLARNLNEQGQRHLLDAGIRSPLDMARMSRFEFMQHHAALGGDAETYALFKANQDMVAIVQHQAVGAWIQTNTTPDDDDDPNIPPGIKDLVNQRSLCGCKDCSSAVSPAAYLAHLMDWVLTHVKDPQGSIAFAELEKVLHQPYGDLPASCESVEEQVNQVRMAVETLWRFTGLRERADLEMPATFRTAYRHLRNQLYKNILTHLGVSVGRLRKATLPVANDTPASELVQSQREAVADILGVDEVRLSGLFFNVEQPGVSLGEEILERLFGYRDTRRVPFSNVTRPDLIKWQRERLESIWQSQDWKIDAYHGLERLPFIDPIVIDETYLRTPLEENPTISLLTARQQALTSHREAMLLVAPPGFDQDAFEALLGDELGLPIAALQALYQTLQSSEVEQEIMAAQASVEEMNFTLAGFSQLMEIHTHLVNDEPLGITDAQIDAASQSVYDILSRAHRHSLFATWVSEENSANIIFGARLFWIPVEALTIPNPWQATPGDRALWEDALRARSQSPLIDPDQILQMHIVVIFFAIPFKLAEGESDPFNTFAFAGDQVANEPPLNPLSIWQSRRELIDSRLATVGEARQGHPDRLEALQAMLAASTSGITLETLNDLRNREAEGLIIGPRLEQLRLSFRAYRFLADQHLLAETGANISPDRWDSLAAILVQIEKQLDYSQWRTEEQAQNITLHPNRFTTDVQQEQLESLEESVWLHDSVALSRWVRTLDARNRQFATLDNALAAAVGEVEEKFLPLLRNILIDVSAATGNSFIEKATWLDQRLMMDMFMDGCHMTTRVSQAIETLQRLVRGIYGQDNSLLEDLSLDAVEDYEREWSVIGSYSTWRAYLLAYLFPENLLHVSPRERETYGFTQYVKKSSVASHADACEAAKKFADYFRDVSHLKVQASCQVRTLVSHEAHCGTQSSIPVPKLHLFASTTTSGKVYWASFNARRTTRDTMTSWRPLLGLDDVVEVIGAVPHVTPTNKAFIVLFVKKSEGNSIKLKYRKYDIDGDEWWKLRDLELPSGVGNSFTVVAIQKRYSRFNSPDFPTLIVIRDSNGMIYLRGLNDNATDWTSKDWVPLIGYGQKKRFSNLHGLVQQTPTQCLLFLEQKGVLTSVAYRRIDKSGKVLGDAEWHSVGVDSEYLGALPWLRSSDVFVFWEESSSTWYKSIPALSEKNGAKTFHDLLTFSDDWLEPLFGISLKDFTPEDFNPTLFAPSEPNDIGPITGLTTNHDVPTASVGYPSYTGNIYDLLDGWSSEVNFKRQGAAEFQISAMKAVYYGIQVEWLAIKRVLNFLVDIKNAEPTDITRWSWKLANDYCKQNSKGKLSLASVIRQFRDIRVHKANLKLQQQDFKASDVLLFGGITLDPGPVEIIHTEAGDSTSPQIASSNRWEIVPVGGHERAALGRTVAVAVSMPNGAFRMKLTRSGNSLASDKIYRLDPRSNGPSNLSPLRAASELQERRADIKAMYEAVAGSPPSVMTYIHEAFNAVPIYFGRELQRQGDYDQALLWYRQVFDYLSPTAQAKIDHRLKLEEGLEFDFTDAEEWLDDTSNAHAIAATRRNSYTRHILLMIIRCLNDSADALFSRDNVTDNSRAREQYIQAIKLADSKYLKPGKSSCENILGQLKIEIVAPGQLPLQQFQVALAKIQDGDHLTSTVNSLRAISQNTNSPLTERLTAMREQVMAALVEIPAAKSHREVWTTQQAAAVTIENQFLAAPKVRTLLQKIHHRRNRTEIARLAEVTNTEIEKLGVTKLPWLRQPKDVEDEQNDTRFTLAQFRPEVVPRLAVLNQIKNALPMASLAVLQHSSLFINSGVSFDFCIPQNPAIQALRRRAENNLNKLRTCRNIAGFVRQIDAYGAPIGIGSGLVSPDGTIFSGIVEAAPTIYRFIALINRAKELVNIAQQIEAGYQNALVNTENEALSVLQAEQSLELAAAQVILQDLGLNRANSELNFAGLQRESAMLREETYGGWINAGRNEQENLMLAAQKDAATAQQAANASRGAAELLGLAASAIGNERFVVKAIKQGVIRRAVQVSGIVAEAAAITGATIATGFAIDAEARAQRASFEASFERRSDEWQLQQGLAAQDILIGDQQMQLARDSIAIAEQERVVAGLVQTHATDILQFLQNKSFNEEMYRWIASVLEDVYRFFLQQAASMARLAERQLAFEQQQGALKIIQSDYWQVPVDRAEQGSNIDRLGLTGSARLLKDIYQVDQYAFETRQRKQQLSISLDLAEMFPFEFQRFRETGVLVFETPQSLIDRQFPGYYLCLIQQVTVSVVALIPPTYGIRASLTSAGISQTVVGGDTFQNIIIRQLPERMALTGSTTSSGEVALEPDAQTLQLPFEGGGFATQYELRIPKATNRFDYNTMATILFTIDFSALHSFDYEQQVIEQLDRSISANRAFRFRNEFADAWYDLHNSDRTDTPMTVRFTTRREDFPPNIDTPHIEHVLLYFVSSDDAIDESPIDVEHMHFIEDGSAGVVGGGATTIDGVISTRRGNGTSWLPMIGRPPIGVWELALPDTEEMRSRFTNEALDDIVLIISYSGNSPAFT